MLYYIILYYIILYDMSGNPGLVLDLFIWGPLSRVILFILGKDRWIAMGCPQEKHGDDIFSFMRRWRAEASTNCCDWGG